MKITILFAATLCTSFAAAAAAQPSSPDETPGTELVSYADLDLGSATDRVRLDWRIHAAASRLCSEDDRASPTGYVNTACFRSAMAGARQQMDQAIARTGGTRVIALARMTALVRR
jgi:UrcA family protein